ncbi:MAG: YdiU family protein [Myxococcota bacterium]|nr:YdiU family protein [Myxococcota bacterium]
MSSDYTSSAEPRSAESPSAFGAMSEEFFAVVSPTPVAAPSLLKLNASLAESLGLSTEWLGSPAGVETLAGNRALPGAAPLAMAYAGHQFGNWVPMLGDGRAVQIGEAIDAQGLTYGIQLKGSGPTPFSRNGDGRAAIGPVLREYVLSEAMFALGIPTTRALAMVKTGEPVYRERAEPGAILTRVASGFVRVGTFQYFAAQGRTDSIRELADHVIERRYADLSGEFDAGPARYRALLSRVIAVQAELIARWMGVGFIHGVMNTDNMSIMVETIDYGPCAFLDEYDPAKVFSSIDRNGRYAYQQQPGIGLWNLTRFAETLVPLLDDEEEAAIEIAKSELDGYAERFHAVHGDGLRQKMGVGSWNQADQEISSAFLDAMAKGKADFTLAFRRLSELNAGDGGDDEGAEKALRSLFAESTALDAFLPLWRARLREGGLEDGPRRAAMLAVNPLFIPRNHRIQEAIDALVDREDLDPLSALLTVTAQPFEENEEHAAYANRPGPDEIVRQTFCGT